MLTDTALRNLKPKSKIYKVFDRDGMCVAVSTAGTITFRYDYRLNGRRETLTLGRYGPAGMSLAMARERLLDAKRSVDQGLSPALEKQRAKRRLTAARTFGKMTERWLADARMADSTRPMRKHIIDRDILPVFQNRKLKEVTPDDLRALCNKVKARGAPATAIHVRDIVKQVYAFAILHGERLANPADDVKAASIATFVPKDRALSPAEIRLAFHQLETIASYPTIRLALRLIGCASQGKPPPSISLGEPVQAQPLPEPPKPVEVVAVPEPLALPAQLKPLPEGDAAPTVPEPADEKVRVSRANAEARTRRPARATSMRFRCGHTATARSIRSMPRGARHDGFAPARRGACHCRRRRYRALDRRRHVQRQRRRPARERAGQTDPLGPENQSSHHHQPPDVPAGVDLDREGVDGVCVLGLSERPDAGLAAPNAGGQRRRAGRYRPVAGEDPFLLRGVGQQSAVEAAARFRRR